MIRKLTFEDDVQYSYYEIDNNGKDIKLHIIEWRGIRVEEIDANIPAGIRPKNLMLARLNEKINNIYSHFTIPNIWKNISSLEIKE